MTVFFTSDTHFGHTNIIKYCDRPFASSNEMDDMMFDNWYAMVQPDDVVYHLGDVAFGTDEKVFSIMERFRNLPGRKYLVPGNHDDKHFDIIATGFDEILPHIAKVSVQDGSRHKTTLVLAHYPLVTWAGSLHGVKQLYGHVHGRIPANSMQADVGVDAWGFAPVRIDQVMQRMAMAPRYDCPEPRHELQVDRREMTLR